jgi:hypothetical protein
MPYKSKKIVMSNSDKKKQKTTSKKKSIKIESKKGKSKSKNNVNNKIRIYSDKYVNKIHKSTGINFQSGSEITTKVETLTGADVHQLDGNYAVVDKADGLRSVLYLGDDKIIRQLDEKKFKEITIKCSGKCDSLTESLIDTEYIAKIKTFFVFDILVFHGKDVRNQSFEKRHELLLKFKDLKWDSKDYNIIVKDYEVDYENFFDACKKVYNRKYKYELDGLVFTPLKGDYGSKSFKWKPLKDLTIDFIVRIRKKYSNDR